MRTLPLLVCAWVVCAWVTATTASASLAQTAPVDVSADWQVLRTSSSETTAGALGGQARWAPGNLTDDWKAVGGSASGEIAWFRKSVQLPPSLIDGQAAVLIGSLRYGRYEVFADGVRIGAFYDDGGGTPVPSPALFPVSQASATDGRVDLVLRVQPAVWAGDLTGSGPMIGGILLGDEQSLRSAHEITSLRSRVDTVPLLAFGLIAGLLGVYQLLLYTIRRERPYVWFGIGSGAFAVNALALSPWLAPYLPDFAVALRLNDASGHVATAFLLLFLFEAFDRPIRQSVAAYIMSHGLLVLFVAAAPISLVIASSKARLVWLVPGLLLAVGLVVLELRRGGSDARAIAVGAIALVLAEVGEFVRVGGAPLPSWLPYAGFTAVLLSMAFVLASRFSRVHRDLEDLRGALELQVIERTAAYADMTERARHANDAKTRFLATMSHELRTPLNSVIGFSKVLLKRTAGVLEPKNRDLLERIHSSGIHLHDLVEDLLDVSSIEAGQFRLEFTNVQVESLVSGVLAELGPQAVSRQTRLTALVPSRLAPLSTDRVRLKQILLNLVGNAVRFTSRGQVTVTVHHEGGVPTAIEITDDGPGIPEHKLEQIFRPFTQVDPTSTRTHDGAGLGLAITQALCDVLGYRIVPVSTVGRGTTMTVLLGREAKLPSRPRTELVRDADQGSLAESRLKILPGSDEASTE